MTFGGMLRSLRSARGRSQLRLAGDAGVSPRHLSFLETGRSSPTREMILTLSRALELQLADRNALLMAAGFAPVYRATPIAAQEMTFVRCALEAFLRASATPTIVLDRSGNVVLYNEDARGLYTWLTGVPLPAASAASASPPPNVLDLVGIMLPFVENGADIARSMLARARRDGVAERVLAPLATLVAERLASPTRAVAEAPTPMVTVRLRKGDVTLSLFSLIATLGTPQDLTLEGLRIESFFPADGPSQAALAEVMRASAPSARPGP